MLRLLCALTLCVAFLACGRLSEKPKDPTTPGQDQVDALQAEHDVRLAAYNADTTSQAGYPSLTDCDTVVFAGEACAGGAAVAIDQVEYSPGEVHRRPKKPAGACWLDGDTDESNHGADTTNSRDTLTGYMACLWARQDLPALTRLAAYGEKNAFVMGRPLNDGRTVLGVNLTGLLGRMIYALSGGADDRGYALAFEAYPPAITDSGEHLLAVGITLQGAVAADIRDRGLPLDVSAIALTDISPGMKSRLEELVRAYPTDYLFQSALGVYTGEFAEAVRLLLDPATPVPSYVRGASPEMFERARWLYAARLVLNHFKRDQ